MQTRTSVAALRFKAHVRAMAQRQLSMSTPRRRLQQREEAPSSVFATGCAAIDSILRDKVLPPAQDTTYTGPFTQFPSATPPEGQGCVWQTVTTGAEAAQIMEQSHPRVKFIEAVTASGNFATLDDPPIRSPPRGFTPAPGTIALFKGNGLRMDMTPLTNAEVPWPPKYNNTAQRSVRVMWDWHIAIPDNSPVRPGSLAFQFTTNWTMAAAKCPVSTSPLSCTTTAACAHSQSPPIPVVSCLASRCMRCMHSDASAA